MNEETIRLMLFLTVGAQRRRHRLALLTRVDEDETFLPTCMRKDITKPGIGSLGRGVGWCAENIRHDNVVTSLPRLCVAHIEMLKGEPPLAPLCLDLRHKGLPPRPCREKIPRTLGIANGRRQADAARLHARNAGKPLDETERLPAAIAAQEGV